MIAINVKALLWTAKAALPHLRAQKGHFILTSPVAVRTSDPGAIYGDSKWFACDFGINLTEETTQQQGRCTTISPKMVNTPFFDKAKPTTLDP